MTDYHRPHNEPAPLRGYDQAKKPYEGPSRLDKAPPPVIMLNGRVIRSEWAETKHEGYSRLDRAPTVIMQDGSVFRGEDIGEKARRLYENTKFEVIGAATGAVIGYVLWAGINLDSDLLPLMIVGGGLAGNAARGPEDSPVRHIFEELWYGMKNAWETYLRDTSPAVGK